MNPLVIIYHNNPYDLYQPEWITKCVRSLTDQTFERFHFVELDYANSGLEIVDDPRVTEYLHEELDSFVEAANYLLDYAHAENFWPVFNVHLDDYYSRDRLESQMVALNDDYDLVSTNFVAINEHGHTIESYTFDEIDIKAELKRGLNTLCNPVVAFNERWIKEGHRYPLGLEPMEDMALWQMEADRMNYKIIPEYCCYKRFHANEVSNGVRG